MRLRLKILALAGVLLLAFAVTTAFSAFFLRQVIDEMDGIVAYHIEITALVAEIDVLAVEYELNFHRWLEVVRDGERVRLLAARQTDIAASLPRIFERAKRLLDKAVADPRNDVADRVQLARVDGTLRLLDRQLQPYLSLGRSLQAALEADQMPQARRLTAGFRAFEAAFGRDLADVRQTIATLTRDSLVETEANERRVLSLNGALFLGAAAVGLGLFALLAQRLSRAFRRLLAGTRSVEAGDLGIEIPVTSRDEVGQLTAAFNRMIGELRSKERITKTFGQFLDPRLVTKVLGAQAEQTQAAERRVVTVFFSDIKGFSTLSEQLTAEVMVRLLNGYFTAVGDVVRARNGIVDKYIGDAVMAFWAPPFSPGDHHAADACLAALAQRAALADFRRELPHLTGLRRDVPEVHVRVGLATGEVVVGTVGSETTKSYTVIGDSVNAASRLEGANKIYGTSIMVSEDTFRLAQHAVEGRELDLLVLAGKTEPIRVFELLAPAGELTPEVAELRGVFAEGLEAYRAQKWDAAADRFRACLRLSPEDGPSRTFLNRVGVLSAHPPPAGWNGVWTADHK